MDIVARFPAVKGQGTKYQRLRLTCYCTYPLMRLILPTTWQFGLFKKQTNNVYFNLAVSWRHSDKIEAYQDFRDNLLADRKVYLNWYLGTILWQFCRHCMKYNNNTYNVNTCGWWSMSTRILTWESILMRTLMIITTWWCFIRRIHEQHNFKLRVHTSALWELPTSTTDWVVCWGCVGLYL